MSEKRKALPVGIDYFEKLIERDGYYVDKTLFIRDLLSETAEVHLFTRPRRFGKTLMMSMLKAFFDIDVDNRALFEGLDILNETVLCEQHMGQYPVLFLTFKSVDDLNFQGAYGMLKRIIEREARRSQFLLDSDRVTQYDLVEFRRIISGEGSVTDIRSSLQTLMSLLHKHYGKRAILIIDEYDVPINVAHENGYYKEMLNFYRVFLGDALKTMEDLQFAVVTGCLRISKESIFSGLNNLDVDTIVDERFDEFFGFTESDVKELLSYYDIESTFPSIKEWYDGYRFGNVDVYNPWDVINHAKKLQTNINTPPQSYWKNTGSNNIIRKLINATDGSIGYELEELIAGRSINRKIDLSVTYDDLYRNTESLWSMLLASGYLTTSGERDDTEIDSMNLVIPNRELKETFAENIQQWFVQDRVVSFDRSSLFTAAWDGDVVTLNQEMQEVLSDSISYHDYNENFYHAFLAGLFSGVGFDVRSNRETGKGRSDVIVVDAKRKVAIVFETKHSDNENALGRDCDKALEQITNRKYALPFERRKYHIRRYGVAFFEKNCKVKMG